uniref:Uncharacterized protein n=1 Tax=Arundo donax TaxID=35708 RepID=A0A0A9FFF8_ARUDO
MQLNCSYDSLSMNYDRSTEDYMKLIPFQLSGSKTCIVYRPRILYCSAFPHTVITLCASGSKKYKLYHIITKKLFLSYTTL